MVMLSYNPYGWHSGLPKTLHIFSSVVNGNGNHNDNQNNLQMCERKQKICPVY